jgi:hypothetical protein
VLIGNTDVEDALQRLNNLTEEARIASAELLRTSRGLGDGVHRVGVEVDRANRQHFPTLLSLLLYLIYPYREPPQI